MFDVCFSVRPLRSRLGGLCSLLLYVNMYVNMCVRTTCVVPACVFFSPRTKCMRTSFHFYHILRCALVGGLVQYSTTLLRSWGMSVGETSAGEKKKKSNVGSASIYHRAMNNAIIRRKTSRCIVLYTCSKQAKARERDG